MKEWFTAQELSGLRGLPTSDRRIREQAKRNSWTSRSRKSGKGFEYHISSLPNTAKEDLISKLVAQDSYAQAGQEQAKKAKESTIDISKEKSLALFNKLPRKSKDNAEAKLAIIFALRDSNLAVNTFVDKYNRKEVGVSECATTKHPRITSASLYRWKNTYNSKGIYGLAGKSGSHRRGSGKIDQDEDLQNFIIGMLVEHPHISNTVLYKAIKTEFQNYEEGRLPKIRAAERWICKWKNENKQVFCAITSPDEWKNQYMAAFGHGSEQITELNQLWEFDSTPADLMLEDGRHTIIGVIDVYTRRIKFVVSRTSNSKGVAQVIRQAILDWGIPKIAKTDNGSDYKSNYIKSVFDALDIKQEFCPPFQAWKKPHIERVFRSFSHDLLELLDGFIGHNVADRKQIESRKQFSDRLFKKDAIIDVNLSSEELQAFCNNWIDNEYHIRTHSELKKTPLEMVRDWGGAIHRIKDERALDILLCEPAGYRVVGKKGISLDGGKYIHPDLGAIVGDEVHIYYDEHDIGRIYVYDMEDEFVCIAEDPSITGVSRKEVAQRTKEVQREAVQEEKRRLKAAAKKISKRDMAQEILAHQAEQARQEKTIDFPRPSQIHTSDRLEAAADALAAKEGLNLEPSSPSTEELQEFKATIIQPQFNQKKQLPEDLAEKYKFWRALDEKVKSGLQIETDYENFYKTFPRSAEFDSGKMLAEMREHSASRL